MSWGKKKRGGAYVRKQKEGTCELFHIQGEKGGGGGRKIDQPFGLKKNEKGGMLQNPFGGKIDVEWGETTI